MSESHGDGQPGSGGQPKNDGQPGSGGQPKHSGQPGSGQPKHSGQPGSGGQPRNSGQSANDKSRGTGSGQTGNDRSQSRTNGQPRGGSQPRRPSDPLADLQRWLMRAGARSMANQVADQVKRTMRQEKRSAGDVWDTATNELPPNEPPECQWCPVCQAARAARLSGPGLSARLADAGGILAAAVQDAFAAFDQIMKTQDQNRSSQPPRATPPPSPESGPTDVAP